MDVLTLRAGLTDALQGLLGTYTLGNGATTPAVSVRATGESMAATTRVSGLEAIIIRDPSTVPVLSYQEPECQSLWILYLVDWSNSGVLGPAARKVVRQFPGTTVEDPIVPAGLGPTAQKRLTVPSSGPSLDIEINAGVASFAMNGAAAPAILG
ncbi:MAG: hypothetical protein ACO3GP_08845 [Candidatus Limnocylindrus sp.]